ncbi:MAG: 1-deoxy-D-xylulose-5-phosphate reductoisomerase [Gammaproteobacteria bacterium]|nr:1-deoxy-D-xylulose-5-phosphate reductoisomerase [Gammaproteobacteria bacterium]
MQSLTVLGATGSIGVSTLNVVSQHTDKYQVFALTAFSNTNKLIEQACEHEPEFVVIADESNKHQSAEIQKRLPARTKLLFGSEALEQVASEQKVDIVMAAIVGAAGVRPTLAAARAGKKVLLANKESLVVTGNLMIDTVKHNNATLLPIDSEHNAIFQCLPEQYNGALYDRKQVSKILLTGSGGPFRETPLDQLCQVTPAQACAHPNWNMGQKISVDSATMMNKGLEVIEACYLFGIGTQQLEVVLHPQSIVHSMVSYCDGSVIAQLGQPDMRTPIAYGLAWPNRIDAGVEPLDFSVVSQLDFSSPDLNRYPCLKLAFEAFDEGGSMPAVLNAANEISVAAFLNGGIKFTDIAAVNESVMSSQDWPAALELEDLLEQDRIARDNAQHFINKLN